MYDGTAGAGTPLVSVLVPCHNAEPFVETAVASALAQTYPHTEVLVVDDGSIDASAAVLARFGADITVRRQPRRGGNAARNTLAHMASGEWLQYLDADDWLAPHKIAAQLAAAAGSEAEVLGSNVTVHHRRDGCATTTVLAVAPEADPWTVMGAWAMPQTGGMLIRRETLRRIGGWRDEQTCCQDAELYLRLLMAGARFAFTGTDGAVYRDWSDDTVSRRDLALNRHTRLELTATTERWLRDNGELTPPRRAAIARSRFELARSIWPADRDWANAIVRHLHAAHPDFPPAGPAAPPAYRAACRWLGFDAAERLAAMARRMAGRRLAAWRRDRR